MQTMQAGEVNKLLKVQANAIGTPAAALISLTGATCVIVAQDPNAAHTSLSTTVAGDGLSCSRLTLATDFPIPGLWTIQLIATYGDGTVWKSSLKDEDAHLFIGPNA